MKFGKAWAEQDNRFWRVILLVLLLVAFLGPWGFEEIHVPAEYPCNAPFVRLEGDFCGQPISGISVYPWIVISFFTASAGLVSGDLRFRQLDRRLSHFYTGCACFQHTQPDLA